MCEIEAFAEENIPEIIGPKDKQRRKYKVT
jgi:hypothetical protein